MHDPLPAGTMIGEHLRVEKQLGEGAMGIVYLARDLKLDRVVAVKIHRDRSTPEAFARLEREARAMAKLAHPNAAAIHEVGVHEDRPYIAMEHVDGGTMREWLAASPRSWREIVELYVQAARGLAAAHDAGFVHRDFKPDNALVGRDGRVRVADFGLSRALTAPRGELSMTTEIDRDEPSMPAPGSGITSELELGSPAYLAPEQRAGVGVGIGADQYALCVSLHEALYGELPARAGTAAPAVTAGGRRAPGWLRGVIARGLRVDPDARWPSVAALADRLERGLVGTRRRTVILVAASVTVIAATVTTALALGVGAPDCDDADERIAAIWSPERNASIAREYIAVAGERGERGWSSAAVAVDAWVTAWIEARDGSCRATRFDATQSELVLDRSMGCFDRRAAELAALLDTLGTPDPKMVAHAMDAVTALPAIAACTSEPYLLAEVEPPGDSAAIAATEQVRARLRAIEAMKRADDLRGALDAARELRPQAEAIGYDPALAEVLEALGELTGGRGQSRDGVELLTAAHLVARRSNHTSIAAQAALRLADIERGGGDRRMGATWLELARADVERGAADPELAIDLERCHGHMLRDETDYDAAIEHYQRALALAIELHSSRLHPGVVHEDVANALMKAGRLEEAAQAHREAIAAFERDYGVGTPKAAVSHGHYGAVLRRLGRIDEAIAEQRTAIAMLTEMHGEESPILNGPLLALGVSLVDAHRTDEGRRELEHALALAEGAELPGSREIASVLAALGWCEMVSEHYEAALGYQRRALALAREARGDDHPDVAKHRTQVGHALMLLGRTTEAKQEYLEALATWARAGQADHPGTSEAWGALAGAELKLGEYAEAEVSAQRVLDLAQRFAVLPPTLAHARCDLARALLENGRATERVAELGKLAIDALLELGDRTDALYCAERLHLPAPPP
jgi:eukaryotic-like serine/threonine-protein kinase